MNLTADMELALFWIGGLCLSFAVVVAGVLTVGQWLEDRKRLRGGR